MYSNNKKLRQPHRGEERDELSTSINDVHRHCLSQYRDFPHQRDTLHDSEDDVTMSLCSVEYLQQEAIASKAASQTLDQSSTHNMLLPHRTLPKESNITSTPLFPTFHHISPFLTKYPCRASSTNASRCFSKMTR